MLTFFSFLSQVVKVHSLKVKGPAANGPKTVRVFKNQPRTLDFSQAESMESIQVSKADTALSYVDGRYSSKKSLSFPNNTTLSIKKYEKSL